MANDFCEIVITAAPLVAPVRNFRADAGAVVDFFGVVRGEESGEEIDALDYEAHVAIAEHQLRAIARAACDKFGVLAVTLHHRIGRVPVAEPSLFVRVFSRHRGPALHACEWIIERLKLDVPIWKMRNSEPGTRNDRTAVQGDSAIGNPRAAIE
jgi:molybdopterin synthase catalytic subunit